MTLPKWYVKCDICGNVHKKIYPPDDWSSPENDREWVRWHKNIESEKKRMQFSADIIFGRLTLHGIDYRRIRDSII